MKPRIKFLKSMSEFDEFSEDILIIDELGNLNMKFASHIFGERLAIKIFKDSDNKVSDIFTQLFAARLLSEHPNEVRKEFGLKVKRTDYDKVVSNMKKLFVK